MKIRLEQQNIGAAVMQIAEHEQFTAINALKINGKSISNAFLVNHDTAVLCKYASEPNSIDEYVFTFNEEHMGNISELSEKYAKIYFGLVCVEDGEICCLSKEQFDQLIDYRKTSAKADESSYSILITIQSGASFRACVNAAGKRGHFAGKKLTIARKNFPNALFS
ncbi:hypothetical protein ACTJ2N_000491 [Vibrio fluvialis]